MHQYKLLLGKLAMHITEPWFLSWIGPAAILAGRKFKTAQTRTLD